MVPYIDRPTLVHTPAGPCIGVLSVHCCRAMARSLCYRDMARSLCCRAMGRSHAAVLWVVLSAGCAWDLVQDELDELEKNSGGRLNVVHVVGTKADQPPIPGYRLPAFAPIPGYRLPAFSLLFLGTDSLHSLVVSPFLFAVPSVSACSEGEPVKSVKCILFEMGANAQVCWCAVLLVFFFLSDPCRWDGELGWVDQAKVAKHCYPPSDDTLVFVCGVPAMCV